MRGVCRSPSVDLAGILVEGLVGVDVLDEGDERCRSVNVGARGVVRGFFGGMVDFVAGLFGSERRGRSGVDLS